MKKIFILSLLMITSLTTVFAQCMEASSDEGVSVVGYLQTQYEYSEATEIGSFTFNRARLGVIGNIPYDFSYYFLAEFSPYAQDAPFLIDAFATYSRLDPWAKISVGRFKSVFGLEMNTGCQSLNTIKRSIVATTLGFPDRDMGIMVKGKYDKYLSYALSLTNATSMGKLGEADDNMNKAFTGRLVFSPLEYVSFGGSYKYGTAKPLDPADPEDERTRFGGELEVKYEDFVMQAEYIQGEDKGTYTVGGS